jgi:hypothetical protein
MKDRLNAYERRKLERQKKQKVRDNERRAIKALDSDKKDRRLSDARQHEKELGYDPRDD